MEIRINRRDFLKAGAALTVAFGTTGLACQSENRKETQPEITSTDSLFRISLAQWSLHRSFFSVNPTEIGWDVFDQTVQSDRYRTVLGGDLDPLDFARVAHQEFGITAIEYVNTFYFDRARDKAYLKKMRNRADDEGVRSLLIMCDAEGNLGDPDDRARTAAIENHHKWVEAAAFLGCHSIRVNARSDPKLSPDEQLKLAADGLHQLCEFADPYRINIIVENHGGTSSDGTWLAGVMQQVNHTRIGTLPDFGNFYLTEDPEEAGDNPEHWYDRYKGVSEMMPYARAISAKTHDFDNDGNDVETDFARMMKIVLDAGYRGYVGIEYEGTRLSETDGILATKALLERVREELAPSYA
jgi:sugar phosphate isomerase/epimerase